MDDFQGSYAPQSPDLSGFNDFDEPEPTFSNPAPTFSNSYYPPPQPSYQQSYQQPQSHDPYSLNQPSIATSQYPSQAMPPDGRTRNQFDDDDDFVPEPKSATKAGPGRKRKPKVEEELCDKLAPGVEEGIEVKTKFPVARIKRIMQADEDIGKVAQVTPTAVSKALELFMISIVTKAAKQTRERAQKRITAVHLKQALQEDEQFDFLAEIIAKVPDAPTSKKKEESEDSEEAVETKKKKKRAPTKRKKKEEEEEEEED